MNVKLFNRILSIIALLIALVILIVTITFFSVTKGTYSSYRKNDPSPEKITKATSGKENGVNAFTDIGQIRSPTKITTQTEEPSVVVLTPWFSYPENDRALFEELSQKEKKIRSIFSTYFSSMTLSQIREKGENTVKKELLEKINEELVMGQIHAVYFNDYIFID